MIALAVRGYLRFRLSDADVVEWLAARGVTVDPSTVYDWVQTFTPRFITAAPRKSVVHVDVSENART